jgi:hypothetical protein
MISSHLLHMSAALMGGSATRLTVADARFDSTIAHNRPDSSGFLIKIGTRNGQAHPPQTHGNVQSLPVFQAGAEASPQFVRNWLRFLSTSRHKERLLL